MFHHLGCNKSQIYYCDSRTQVRYGNSPILLSRKNFFQLRVAHQFPQPQYIGMTLQLGVIFSIRGHKPPAMYLPVHTHFFRTIPNICQGISVRRPSKNLLFFFRSTTHPPTAHNHNYRGSRCLTLTSRQPIYPNAGAKT